MQHRSPILQIAIPSPLHRTFDYLPPSDCKYECASGVRLRIPFGRTTKIGILLNTGKESRVASQRLKQALEVINKESLLPADILELMTWACRYYHHPPGEVVFSALPALLRQGHAAELRGTKQWLLSDIGKAIDAAHLTRAPRQAVLMNILQHHPYGLESGQLTKQMPQSCR